MQSNKEDFKGFISELTAAIIEDILYEDMKALYGNFEKTNERMTKLATDFNQELGKLQKQVSVTQELTSVLTSVKVLEKDLNKVLGEATTNLRTDSKKVLEFALERNEKLYREYQKEVCTLNEAEREKFQRTLLSTFINARDGFIREIKANIEISIQRMEKDNVEINKRLGDIWEENNRTRIKYMEEFHKTVVTMHKIIDEKTQQIDIQARVKEMKDENEEMLKFLKDIWKHTHDVRADNLSNLKAMSSAISQTIQENTLEHKRHRQDVIVYIENMEEKMLHGMKRQSRLIMILNLIFGSIAVLLAIALYLNFRGIL